MMCVQKPRRDYMKKLLKTIIFLGMPCVVYCLWDSIPGIWKLFFLLLGFIYILTLIEFLKLWLLQKCTPKKKNKSKDKLKLKEV
jgi:hypothetical protein